MVITFIKQTTLNVGHELVGEFMRKIKRKMF